MFNKIGLDQDQLSLSEKLDNHNILGYAPLSQVKSRLENEPFFEDLALL